MLRPRGLGRLSLLGQLLEASHAILCEDSFSKFERECLPEDLCIGSVLILVDVFPQFVEHSALDEVDWLNLCLLFYNR